MLSNIEVFLYTDRIHSNEVFSFKSIWEDKVIAGIQSYKHFLELDADLIFMAYDMEGISEDAIAEYTESAKRILNNRD